MLGTIACRESVPRGVFILQSCRRSILRSCLSPQGIAQSMSIGSFFSCQTAATVVTPPPPSLCSSVAPLVLEECRGAASRMLCRTVPASSTRHAETAHHPASPFAYQETTGDRVTEVWGFRKAKKSWSLRRMLRASIDSCWLQLWRYARGSRHSTSTS